MNHFKHLFKHELLQHIYSLKFLTMGTFAVVFGLLSIYVQTMDYKARKRIYDEEVIKAQQTLTSAGVYSQLTVPIIVPPNPLSLYAKGVDDKIGSKINIALMEVPRFENTAQKKNPFLDIFDTFDLTTLVQVLFSIMTLFLVADAIAGEREEGTLKQTFSNSVLKSQYFLAKYLGSLVVLAIPLSIIYILSILIILFDPLMTLSAVQWLTIFNIYLCSIAFVSVYVLIGLCISARTNSSSMASLMGLLLWIVLVFIYPNASRYAVNSFIQTPSTDAIEAGISELNQQIKAEAESAYPERLNRSASYSWSSGGDYGLTLLIGVTQKYMFEYHLACARAGIPIVLEGQDRIYQMIHDYKQQYARQQGTASLFTRFLPGYLLTESSAKMAGTHFQKRDLDLMDHAKQYRNQFVDYIRTKGGFGYAFFTQMPVEAMRDDWDQYPDDITEKFSPNNYKKLVLDDMPVYRPPSTVPIPGDSIIDLMTLLILNVILFIFGGLLFSRSDVRNRD